MSGPAPRWLFVVARDQVNLLTFMNRDAFLDPDVAVVWDPGLLLWTLNSCEGGRVPAFVDFRYENTAHEAADFLVDWVPRSGPPPFDLQRGRRWPRS